MDRENPKSLLISRLKMVGSSPNMMFYPLWVEPEPPLIWSEIYKKLTIDNPFIIFDSFVRFHNHDENSATDMAKVMRALKNLAKMGQLF